LIPLFLVLLFVLLADLLLNGVIHVPQIHLELLMELKVLGVAAHVLIEHTVELLVHLRKYFFSLVVERAWLSLSIYLEF
jgi:hypothetical protein